MASLKRDDNDTPVLGLVEDNAAAAIRNALVDPVTGRVLVSATGILAGTMVDNEVVSGSGTAWTLANTPTAGTEHLFANGQRLAPTTDYTIVGAAVTTLLSWTTGTLLADYRY